MGRIRTIKPELPQNEKLGRCSREPRLCFLLLATLADDEGRLRGNPRMLASLLYPYDADAPQLIDSWLAELHREGCIRRYVVDTENFIEIMDWLDYQRIDKPSPSKLPPFRESSGNPPEAVASHPVGSASTRNDSPPTRESSGNPPEDSLRKGREGNGAEGKGSARRDARSREVPLPADFAVSDRVRSWALTNGYDRLDERLESFTGKARAKGYTYIDWDEAFMSAIRDGWARPHDRGNGAAARSGAGTPLLPY